MKELFEKLLLEEDGFEDEVEETETQEYTELENETEEPEIEEPVTDDTVTDSEGNMGTDTELSHTASEFAELTTYKVTFTLGKHTNWSRVDATSKEEAEQIVTDYITKKWADRDFECQGVEEFKEDMEESLNESLNEDAQGTYSDKINEYLQFLLNEGKEDDIPYLVEQLIRYCKEDDLKDLWFDRLKQVSEDNGFEKELDESLTDAQPIEDGAAIGMATVISNLIKDEYEAIDGYNSAIATAEAEGFGDMVNVLAEIQAEENIHIGQLQAVMNTLDPNAHLVSDGQQEGIQQLSGIESTVEESLNENVEIGRPDYTVNMTDDEYEDFRTVLTQHYGSPEQFFKRLHRYTPDFEIHTVDYDDIPEDTITLSSADISQGTGNVIVYTAMGRDTGKIYRYADF